MLPPPLPPVDDEAGADAAALAWAAWAAAVAAWFCWMIVATCPLAWASVAFCWAWSALAWLIADAAEAVAAAADASCDCSLLCWLARVSCELVSLATAEWSRFSETLVYTVLAAKSFWFVVKSGLEFAAVPFDMYESMAALRRRTLSPATFACALAMASRVWAICAWSCSWWYLAASYCWPSAPICAVVALSLASMEAACAFASESWSAAAGRDNGSTVLAHTAATAMRGQAAREADCIALRVHVVVGLRLPSASYTIPRVLQAERPRARSWSRSEAFRGGRNR